MTVKLNSPNTLMGTSRITIQFWPSEIKVDYVYEMAIEEAKYHNTNGMPPTQLFSDLTTFTII